jgi:hypothetical protein
LTDGLGDEKSELLDGTSGLASNDDIDHEIDEILGHSLADREEEAAMHSPSPSARVRRLSHEQQVLELTAVLAADGIHEDRSENAIMPPDVEFSLLAAAVDQQAQHRLQPIEQATLVRSDDEEGQDVDLSDANDDTPVSVPINSDAVDAQLAEESALARIDTPRVSFINATPDAVPMDLDSICDPESDDETPVVTKDGWMESDDANIRDAEVLNDGSTAMGEESAHVNYDKADVEATNESGVTAS